MEILASRPTPPGIAPTPSIRNVADARTRFSNVASWGHSTYATWCSPRLEVVVGEGSGQYRSPFNVSADSFKQACQDLGFSHRLLNRVVHNASAFEHIFHYSENESDFRFPAYRDIPRYLEVYANSYENCAFFCLFKYDLKTFAVKCLLSIKPSDALSPFVSTADDIIQYFREEQKSLERHPLLVLNFIVSFMQSKLHDYSDWRVRLNDMESRLGVTRHAKTLKAGLYDPISYDFDLLIADLASLTKRATDTMLAASTLLDYSKAIQRLVAVCEGYAAFQNAEASELLRVIATSEAQEEVLCTIKQEEIYVDFCRMVQTVLQGQATILFNRLSRQDSRSMKTIAVVTLFFLPSTLVSAVCASGIFNFHATEPPDAPQTISRYGWIYLLVCVLTTVVTLTAWLIWYFWGGRRLELYKLSQLDWTTKSNSRKPRATALDFPAAPGEEGRNPDISQTRGFRSARSVLENVQTTEQSFSGD